MSEDQFRELFKLLEKFFDETNRHFDKVGEELVEIKTSITSLSSEVRGYRGQ